jgi:hypothetical protein
MWRVMSGQQKPSLGSLMGTSPVAIMGLSMSALQSDSQSNATEAERIGALRTALEEIRDIASLVAEAIGEKYIEDEDKLQIELLRKLGRGGQA